jgi:hypothetical protein
METQFSTSTKVPGVYKKLLTFQKSVEAIKKDAVNGHFKSCYFDINGLLSEVKPKLNAAGLIILQTMNQDHLISRIIDVDDGSEVSCTMVVPLSTKAHEVGSWISYARRYSLQALLGLEGEDDDGNTASGRAPTTSSAAKPAGSFGKFGGKN